MNEIFKKRRQDYYEKNLKYLRYVFNDHFLLFLLIMIGALAVQYAQFLQHNQLSLLIRLAILFLVSLASLFFGKVASFLEPADSTFLLPKEEELKKYIASCQRNSLLFPAVLYALLLLILYPLLKLNFLWLILCFIIFLLIKMLLYRRTFQAFEQQGNLDWEALIRYEQNRQVGILKVYSLFTNVKGLQSHAHRRKYLDFLLPKKEKSASSYLFFRTFLRTGDYFGLTLRLLFLSLLGIVFIRNLWLVLLFTFVMAYLLIFQLLPLAKSHEYHPLLAIYPKKAGEQERAVRTIVFRIFLFVLVIECLLLIIINLLAGGLINSLIILAYFVASALLFRLYIKYRLPIKK